MGKLTGAQHLMKAAGVDPENPIGSLLEKAGVDPKELVAIAQAIPEIIKGISERQARVEKLLLQIADDQTRILFLLENRTALPSPMDTDDVLDAIHLRQLSGNGVAEVQENAEGALSH
jgi:hypothetical protein